MAFLQRVVNGNGTLEREYAIGRGRMDLCLRYGDLTLGMELKVWRDGAPTRWPRAWPSSTATWPASGLDTGWLVIFDRRTGIRRWPSVRLVFMTGVTKFSKVSLFSGLNQLNDLTLDARFATVCGYTQRTWRPASASTCRAWTGTGSSSGTTATASSASRSTTPSTSCCSSTRAEYRNYWFETGSPSFLIELLPRRATFLPDLEGIEASEEILDSFDIERIDPITLLFQTGYLTIDSTRWHRSRLLYRLRLPNQEVRMALADRLIDGYLGTMPGGRDALQDRLYDALSEGDLAGLVAAIQRLFAGVPGATSSIRTCPRPRATTPACSTPSSPA
jgi:hypothetical protein